MPKNGSTLKKNRIIIAGTSSGSGKTTLTTGILQCLVDRGYRLAAFKCGPDYIDPMFHSRVIGAKVGNLDPFFSDAHTLRYLLYQESQGTDITVIEGAMGYYDGIGFTKKASTCEVAEKTDTPVVLVVNAAGMGLSVMHVLKGFLTPLAPDGRLEPSSHICGVIYNNMSARLYPQAARLTESLGIRPLGYLPKDTSLTLKSRHLGLVTAAEVRDLKEKTRHLARRIAETVDIDGIIELARSAGSLDYHEMSALDVIKHEKEKFSKSGNAPRIAVAQDEAFCFTYRENLEFLQKSGCELVYFSPIHDKALPEGISGLLLAGGYPELYAASLSANSSMLASVRDAVMGGMPVIAECGGYMYLHEYIEDEAGERFSMVGIYQGGCKKGSMMPRFGYVELISKRDGMLADADSVLRGHEFHYWQSDSDGADFTTLKPDGSASWDTGHTSENVYAGFAHIFFYATPEAAARFCDSCAAFSARCR